MKTNYYFCFPKEIFQFSIFDFFLQMDDLTTDRTVSPDNQSNAIDYMEDVMVP